MRYTFARTMMLFDLASARLRCNERRGGAIATGTCATIDAIGAKVTACTDVAQVMCEVP